MCAMSMMLGYMVDRVPVEQWDRKSYNLFDDIIQKVNELDVLLGQADCVDPIKQDYVDRVKKALGIDC